MDKKYLIKKGKKVTIEIDRAGQKNQKHAPKIPKGLISSRRENDYQARRLSFGNINFYDCGQIKSGEVWLDIGWQKIPNWTFISSNTYLEVDELTLSDWQDLIDYLMLVSFEDFPATYRKLEYADAFRYGIQIYNGTDFFSLAASNPKWTTSGLKVPLSSANFNLLAGSAFNTFGDISPTNISYKITSEFDYAAQAVSLSFNKPTDFFLVPMIICESATSRIRFDGTLTGYLNYIYRPASRETFLDNPLLNAALPNPYFTYRSLSGVPVPDTSLIFDEILALLASRSGARHFKVGTGSAAVGDFPNGDDIFFDGDGAAISTADLIDGAKATVPEGGLLAFIKQGANWYYLWQSESYLQGTVEGFQIGLTSF